MPTYEYYNKKTKEYFTEILPVHRRKYPCRDPFVELVISAPRVVTISDIGGKEDKAREQILEAAEKGYKEREQKNKNIPEWSKERREKSKQKRRWA